MDFIFDALIENWKVWFVTITLIVAAVIDGIQLKVPNWLTYPMIFSGWIVSTLFAGSEGMLWYEGLGWSLLGTLLGLVLLLPAYAIGGMGAGDVKLLAGVGAWMHCVNTAYGFFTTAIVGGIIAIIMVLYSKGWTKHSSQFWFIVNEIMTVKDPEKLAEIAAERKSKMFLLPYGIPIAIGCIVYFAWAELLV